MPLYLDTHKVKGVTAQAVAEAHKKDLEVQGRYGVNYLKYWVDEKEGTVYCLVDAPTAEAATKVHKEAHGLVAQEIHEVKEGRLPSGIVVKCAVVTTRHAVPEVRIAVVIVRVVILVIVLGVVLIGD